MPLKKAACNLTNPFLRNLGSVAAGLFALVLAPVAQAQIGINFTGGLRQLAATDQPGIVAGANWNNAIGSTGTNVALHNSTGAATTARLTFNSQGSFDGSNALQTPNAATNLLYRGSVFGDSAGVEDTITLTNIPYALYDVYVYASQDTTATNTLSLSNGVTTFYYKGNGQDNSAATSLLLSTSTDPLNPSVGSAHYEVFHSQSGSTFNLTTGGSINGVIANQVFGLQIIQNTPEPGSVALLVGMGTIGAGCLLRRRRKARKSA